MANKTRTHNIHFMVNEQERDLIQQQMEQAGIKSMRAYMLKMATEGRVLRLDLSGVREMVRLLSNATNNINQIARRANQTHSVYASDLNTVRQHYDEIWGQTKQILRQLSEL